MTETGSPVPGPRGLFAFAGNRIAIPVHHSQQKQRRRLILVRRGLQPAHRLLIVLWEMLAKQIIACNIGLGIDIAGLGALQTPVRLGGALKLVAGMLPIPL